MRELLTAMPSRRQVNLASSDKIATTLVELVHDLHDGVGVDEDELIFETQQILTERGYEPVSELAIQRQIRLLVKNSDLLRLGSSGGQLAGYDVLTFFECAEDEDGPYRIDQLADNVVRSFKDDYDVNYSYHRAVGNICRLVDNGHLSDIGQLRIGVLTGVKTFYDSEEEEKSKKRCQSPISLCN